MINWHDNNQKISKYFTVGEVTRRDPRRIPTNPIHVANILRLAKELDEIREEWGSAIAVTSWYRPPAVNAAIGGAKHSQHITGSAVDIKPVNGELLKMQKWLDTRWQGALGYGAKKGFVHLDLRGIDNQSKSIKSSKIRWNY
jgi:uncharacterized protein YcbK (DUF882 family)